MKTTLGLVKESLHSRKELSKKKSKPNNNNKKPRQNPNTPKPHQKNHKPTKITPKSKQ